ncbi:FAD-dependent oxidoreductase [Gordonia sp. TBRC 11910]|uniref:FAD-dependent oxidoreductase n=1 Tax=Gordonia asplenii TaxID=2725283 RepID=A0A848KZ82_9ACTN|nr:FAD-dependent oxidoreductase [Gordonia asplenii]NMO01723.1 FAD-dependent oxidoreductase [Gordonia asplenii]
MKDVVIIGGGVAGLAAGWRLRHWDALLLESDSRVGGRVRSERRGQYWLNWGGHVYAGGNSSTAWLLDNVGIDAMNVPGSLTGLSMNGKLLLNKRVETFPFRVPMPMSSRVGIIKTGAKVGLAVAKYARIVGLRAGETEGARQQRVYDFMNDRTFADYVGDLPDDVEALFKPTVTRSAGDMDELSAGAGVGYFSLVWGIGAGLTKNIVGGPSTLTEAIAASLGDKLQLGARVHEVVQRPHSVVVRYRRDGIDHEVEARTAVLATPATVSHRIAVDIDSDVREALGQVKYGPHVSAAFLTDETTRQVWDDSYAIATPKRSFNVVINPANVVRSFDRARQPGGSIMTFSPAGLGRRLLDVDDADIIATYLDDLDDIFGDFSGKVVEASVAKWADGSPYSFPGRAKLQPTLTRRGGRIFLAGDYLGTLYTESAIGSALSAAQEVQSVLATERQRSQPKLSVAAGD